MKTQKWAKRFFWSSSSSCPLGNKPMVRHPNLNGTRWAQSLRNLLGRAVACAGPTGKAGLFK